MSDKNKCGCGHSHENAKNSCCQNNCKEQEHIHHEEYTHECCCHDEDDCCDEHEGCSCNHESSKNEVVTLLFRAILAVIFTVAANRINNELISLVLFLAAYLIAGYDIVLRAVKNIFKGELFDENFLMALATIGAFCIGDFSEAVAVMVFYQVGEMLQGIAVSRSKKNISSLMDIRPDYATVLENNTEKTVSPNKVNQGDIIIIKPGERIPLDGVVLTGESVVDTSALTGESMPMQIGQGSSIISGSVNISGVITAKVTSSFEQSTVQKILKLVSESSSKKAQAEKFITRFAKVYTPIVILLAVLVAFAPPLVGFGTFGEWFKRGLIFLVVSCPCALVISIPVSFMGGIGGAAKHGVLVKGGDVIDSLYSAEQIVFDKTGTLTKGSFEVAGVYPADGVSEQQLISCAAACERSSNHPIAASIKKAYSEYDSGDSFISYEEKSGYGIIAKTANKTMLAGNKKLMDMYNVDIKDIAADYIGSVLYIAENNEFLGIIIVADTIREGTEKAISELRSQGIKKLFMLTGDRKETAKAVSEQIGLDGFNAELLPHDKVAAFDKLKDNISGKSVFVGDGINDAPLLAGADISVAMGGVGSDAAIEAADIVLMTDDISKLVNAVRIARGTRSIVIQNIAFALGVKAAVLIAAAFGYAPMWLAIFADVGVALIAVLNATRAMKIK